MPDTRAITHASVRIPSLDGLRALAIGLVLTAHAAGTAHYPRVITALTHTEYLDLGSLGVRVFFIISGFLITGLLLREVSKTGEIDLPAFYVRRAVRILPAYVTFVAITGLAAAAGVLHLTAPDLWHAATFTMNYSADRSWSVGHLWSLAVEEQFYFLWPVTVALLPRRLARRCALATILIVPCIRLAETTWAPAYRGLIGTTFETSADALALGCLLAFDREWLWTTRWYRPIARPSVVLGLFLLGVLVSLRFRPGLILGATLTNCAIVIAIDLVVRFPTSRVGRVLNWAPLMWIGTLSYSLYLWQQLFLNRSGTSAWTAFPLNVLAAFLVALASYYWIEHPALNRRARVMKWMRPTVPQGSGGEAGQVP